MTTRKDLIVERYCRLEENLPTYFDVHLFPNLNEIDVSVFIITYSHSTKPIFLRFVVFFAFHLLKVSNGETETELFWGSWVDQPVVSK